MDRKVPTPVPTRAAGSETREAGMAAFRGRRLKLAVATSVGSKVVTIIVQILALPLAINALGAERYGVFVTLTAALAWVGMANLGIGRGLTQGIARSAANDDRASEEHYFSSAFFFVFGIAVVLLTAFAIVLWKVPIGVLFSEQYTGFASEIRWGLLFLGVLFVLQLLAVSTVESAQAGYQEQYINNLWGMAGNASSLALLFVMAFFWPTIAGMIAAVYGGVVLAKLINGVRLLVFSRPYLMPRLHRFDFGLSKLLLTAGLALFFAEISLLANQTVSLLIVGKALGPESVAAPAIMFRLILLFFGALLMITQPLWPAITDAMTRGEVRWVRGAYRRMVLLSMPCSVVVGLMVAVAGQAVVQLWIGPEVLPSWPLQALFGLYFVLMVWTYAHYITLIGLGWLWSTAAVLVTESLVMIPLTLWFIGFMGNTGVAAALCLSNICLSAWALPFMTRVAMQRGGVQ